MLESVTLRRSDRNDEPIDAGLLAEAILFYQNVHLVLDFASLVNLLKTIGPRVLIEIIEKKIISCTFLRHTTGVLTNTINNVITYDFAEIEFLGRKDKEVSHKYEDKIQTMFERAIGDSWESKKYARKFCRLVPARRLSHGLKENETITKISRRDLFKQKHAESVAKIVLNEFNPNLIPQGFYFKAHELKNGFIIDTNLDFSRFPEHITPASLAGYVMSSRADLWLSTTYTSDYITTPVTSQLMQLHFDSILLSKNLNTEQIDLFFQNLFPGMPTIREKINSREKSFEEFLLLLKSSQNFQKWVSEINPDEELLAKYIADIKEEKWLPSLPEKAIRFLAFAGLGSASGAILEPGAAAKAALAAGAFDSLVLDKLLGGWKPNQFVEYKLRDFIEPD